MDLRRVVDFSLIRLFMCVFVTVLKLLIGQPRDNITLPYSLFPFCFVHVCVLILHVWYGLCVCTCMWRPRVDVRNYPPLFFYRNHWGRVYHSNLELTDTAGVPNQFAVELSCLYFWRLDLKMGCMLTWHRVSGDPKLQSSLLHSKHFNHWAISPAPCGHVWEECV